MENQLYEVKGTFKIGDDWRPYAKVIEAPNEKAGKRAHIRRDGKQTPPEKALHHRKYGSGA